MNNDGGNCLRLIQLQPNEHTFNTATTETNAYMYFQVKGSSYMGLFTEGVQMYKDLEDSVNQS